MDIEENGPKGALNTALPAEIDGENIAVVIMGSEQRYPLLAIYDAAGRTTKAQERNIRAVRVEATGRGAAMLCPAFRALL